MLHLSWTLTALTFSHALFFFTHPATTEIYTLSLHDALPISRADDSPPGGRASWRGSFRWPPRCGRAPQRSARRGRSTARSEEHTSELQSHSDLVCRLLLEKKKKKKKCTSKTKETIKQTSSAQ